MGKPQLTFYRVVPLRNCFLFLWITKSSIDRDFCIAALSSLRAHHGLLPDGGGKVPLSGCPGIGASVREAQEGAHHLRGYAPVLREHHRVSHPFAAHFQRLQSISFESQRLAFSMCPTRDQLYWPCTLTQTFSELEARRKGEATI